MNVAVSPAASSTTSARPALSSAVTEANVVLTALSVSRAVGSRTSMSITRRRKAQDLGVGPQLDRIADRNDGLQLAGRGVEGESRLGLRLRNQRTSTRALRRHIAPRVPSL
jgi:hypothetical protein